jgi:hypothetical protein
MVERNYAEQAKVSTLLYRFLRTAVTERERKEKRRKVNASNECWGNGQVRVKKGNPRERRSTENRAGR